MIGALGVLSLVDGAFAAAPAMQLGFTDLTGAQAPDLAGRQASLEHLVSTRSKSLRIMWSWADVETSKPADNAGAVDPGATIYDFSKLDSVLRDVDAAGVEPLLMFDTAPSWWEGAGRPAVSSEFPAGTWKPDAAAYGRFVTAAAKRYSGTYPDPLNAGKVLPRVRNWQIWNEPNLYVYLNPQWTGSAGHWVANSPKLYKRLLSAGYDAVKAVSRDNVVVTAGTAPFAEPWPGAHRMPAARFVRELLCVDGRAKPSARNCRSNPAKFDILAHHPYPIGPPGRHAINADDVVIPDFSKLTKPLKVAISAGNVYPKTTKKIWATEMSWDSSPPDPGGIPAEQQAQYLAGAVYVLWRQGVSALYWWNLRDDPKGAGYTHTLQSGVFYRGATVTQDTPKSSYTAMRFPFVAYRAYSNFKGHGAAKLWGMAPAPGSVEIQKKEPSGWRTIKKVTAQADHVFQLRIAVGRGIRLRAVQSGEASIDAKVF